MQLGLFMMPLHSPDRDFTAILKEDRDAIVLADRLGYDEAWVGEHYSCKTEPIADPLQFMAMAAAMTNRIKFGSGVINLPQHHPAQVAGNVAQFDHLVEGRFIMGIGPGGLGSDYELFETSEKDRGEMMVESIDMIHAIWRSDPPYRIHGKYWKVVIEKQVHDHLGIGPMHKPYQKPFPPIAVSAMSPNSSTARLAGQRGWGLVSAHFTPGSQVRSHWRAYTEGAAEAGVRSERANWRVVRSIICTRTDADAAAYLSNETCSPGWHYKYLRDNLATFNMTKILKSAGTMTDDGLTVPNMLKDLVISGSPRRVLEGLITLVDEIGVFGTLLVAHKDWDDATLHRESMRLISEEVMPRLNQHIATMAAE
ncbi:LLM class flavin-dependent oxidoreductase [Acidisoma sp. S159]|uniref:LLM class flavin-dependent oxidoreductase n=1 Tax=Acidisoma sp. S159 TaxID=1747225 RepID=UPI00131B380C|nr:LLM class flavin-dependent oxidoreductase [Acidisoma sp. S159]